MPKMRTFTKEDIDRVRMMLKTAPEKPKAIPALTAREMVSSIKTEINDLQKRGYSLEEIAEMIRNGFNLENLGASTLKQYLTKKRTISKAPKTSSSK